MFSKDTVIAMGNKEGTCIPLGSLAALSLKDGFTSKRVPKTVSTFVGAQGQFPGDKGMLRVVSGVVSSGVEKDSAGNEIPVDQTTTGELALFVATKKGHIDSAKLVVSPQENFALGKIRTISLMSEPSV